MKYFTPRADEEDLESAALQQLLLGSEQQPKLTKRSSFTRQVSEPTMFNENDYLTTRDVSIRRQKGTDHTEYFFPSRT